MSDAVRAEHGRVLSAAMRRMALSYPAAFGYVAAIAVAGFVTPFALLAIPAILIGCYAVASSEAKDKWWTALAEHFGMHVGPPELMPWTPLLRSGDEREVECLATDGTRTLAQFVSTDVSRDSKGNKQRIHHRYTVVVYEIPAPQRLRFLAAHERQLMGLMDDKRGRMPSGVDDHDLESTALNKRYSVRISNEDVHRLGVVFEPAFMLWFAEHGRPFEYEIEHLVVYDDTHMTSTADYADLLDDAAQIYARLRDAVGNPLPPQAPAAPPTTEPGSGSVAPPGF